MTTTMGVGKIFFRGVATADFSRGWPKSCFPGSANSGEILFYHLETM